MTRRKANAPLRVVLNGRDVGTLVRASSGAIGFHYALAWWDQESAIPVSLSLPRREDGHAGEPVLAVFENLLPHNKPVREPLAARFDAGGTDAFSMLSAIGRDCVGALQFCAREKVAVIRQWTFATPNADPRSIECGEAIKAALLLH